MAVNKGLIVYFDGPDGVGKTTQLKLAGEALRQAGHEVYETRTLGGTPLGEMLRQAMLSDNPRPVTTNLYIALACQHVLAPEVIARRQQGQIVLIDRSPLSIIGYQVYGDGLSADKGYEATGELIGLIKPDLLIAYRATDENLVQRRQQRDHQKQVDRFEKKSPTYHKLTAQGFEEAAKRFGATVIDGDLTPEVIHQATMEPILALLKA